MRKEIINLHRKLETTTIYVTHDQTEAMTMATRIVVLNDGHIEQVGTPEEIYSNPKTMFVAGFIGAPSMNFVKGSIANNKPTLSDRSEEHTSDSSHVAISYAVFCLKKHI